MFSGGLVGCVYNNIQSERKVTGGPSSQLTLTRHHVNGNKRVVAGNTVAQIAKMVINVATIRLIKAEMS
jgi:hypothetical protein